MNKCAEFLYHPIDIVEAFAMRSYEFYEVLQMKQAHHMKNEIKLNYKYSMQDPVQEHRLLTL